MLVELPQIPLKVKPTDFFIKAMAQHEQFNGIENPPNIAMSTSGSFFGPFEKNSRMRKLKPQENNSKLKQKTQGFGKVWKIKYKY